ncbi:glycosyltransferase family 4 protein [Thermodesulfovibrio sp.]|uniref:glycosyltransferase family 4 protein n=1 Tax=Thermodesulfovibrio sp. TaxID=2067987 RepID=UPI0030B6A171
MQIAIIRKKFTFHGGSESYINSLIKFLIAKGHKVYIYSIKWQNSPQGLPIIFKKIPALSFSSFLRDLTFIVFGYFVLRKDRNNIDIIQSHDKFLIQDIYRAGDGCHIQWLKERWKRVNFFKKIAILLNPYHWLILLIERMIFKGKRFKKVIAISEMVKRNIVENYELDPDDIVIIYNGTDLDKFEKLDRETYRNQIRKKFGIDNKDFVLLFVGSGFERKGVKYLIEAAEKVEQPLTVLVVGKGNSKRYVKYIKKQRVIFCGPQREIEKFYVASDLFLFPTIYEPFGLVVLEAMASGLPVITTKLCGASEIITHGENGFVVDTPEETHKIAEFIKILTEQKDIYNNMRFKARVTASNFSMEKNFKNIENLYEIVKSSKGSNK